MKIYTVGGSVRDEIMGLKSKDIDFVVVGSSPKEMRKMGFIQVGADFPVFLDPKNNQEYALARIEKKIGKGYLGFETKTDDISLKEDLFRRDLTINAIAKDEKNNFIDYFNGIEDIKNRKLRHVSEFFAEDPVRVLRIARFQCRFSGFKVANETKILIHKIKQNNLLLELTAERVYKELEKTFFEKNPSLFFETLKNLNTLDVLFPEVFQMIGVRQNPKYHLEDLFTHSMLVLNFASNLTENIRLSENKKDKNRRLRILFSALFHDIGKLKTHKIFFNSGKHYGHENREIIEPMILNLAKKLKLPKVVSNFMLFVAELHGLYGHFFELTPKKIVEIFKKTKNIEDLEDILIVVLSDQNGRITTQKIEKLNINKIKNIYINFRSATKNFKPPENIQKSKISELVHKMQLKSVKDSLSRSVF